jgi:hypothetical protein
VRLSPKSIFIGLVALGLPVSVAIGWIMATPTRGPAAVSIPGIGGLGTAAGNDAVGAAPERALPRPATTVKFSPQPARSAAVLLPATAPSAAPTATTLPPVTELPTSTLPTLDQPPVPTPTEIEVPPTGSTSASAAPSGQPSNSTDTP